MKPNRDTEYAVPFRPNDRQTSAMRGLLAHQVAKVRTLRAEVQHLERVLAAETAPSRKAKRVAATKHRELDAAAEVVGALRKRLRGADALPPSRYQTPPENRNAR